MGKLEGFQEMVVEALNERFGDMPAEISTIIQQIDDQDKLKWLLRQSITSSSIDEFTRNLNGDNSPTPSKS